MKKPALFLTIMFVAMIGTTAVVSTTISGICRNFYKSDTEKNINVKATPVDKQANDLPMAIGIKQASAKL